MIKIEFRKQEGKVAGVEGLEPPTIGFGDRCSTNSNYTPISFIPFMLEFTLLA